MQQFKCRGASINIKNLTVQIQPTGTQRGISKTGRRENSGLLVKSAQCAYYMQDN